MNFIQRVPDGACLMTTLGESAQTCSVKVPTCER